MAQSLGDRTDYAKNPEKTEKGELVTAFGCDPMTVDEEFLLQKRLYFQQTGKTQKGELLLGSGLLQEIYQKEKN